MAGRRDIVASLERAFRSERRRPELTTLFSGARGMGKTSLMALLAHKAEALGWIAVSVTALPGMVVDIEIGTCRAARHLLSEREGRHVSGVGVASVGSVQFTREEQAGSNWRYHRASVAGGVLGESKLVFDDEGRNRGVWERRLFAADDMLFFAGGPYGERRLFTVGV